MATSIFVMVSIPFSPVQYCIAPCRPSLAEFLLGLQRLNRARKAEYEMPDLITETMAQAGSALTRAVDHIWVLTLPRAATRVAHMRQVLEQELQLRADHVTYFEGASAKDWGQWPKGLLPDVSTSQSGDSAWWLPPATCTDDNLGRGRNERPPCLQRRYRNCLAGAGSASSASSLLGGSSLPAVCNEICYTLSVVGALVAFLKTGHQRALLLEDDVCATTALLSPSTRRPLDWMAAHSDQWDLVKLGDCFRGGRAFLGMRRGGGDRSSQREMLATGTCVTREQRVEDELAGRGTRRRDNNSLMPRLPRAYCTHALAVSRRMAKYLIEQAFPASDVFDSLLIHHIAPSIRQQSNDRRTSSGATADAPLKLWSFNHSLFAQIAKVTPNNILKPALRSYERTVDGTTTTTTTTYERTVDGMRQLRLTRGTGAPKTRLHGRVL